MQESIPRGSHFISALWHHKLKPRHHMQDASTDHMINVLLCECAWGRLEPGPKWVPVGRLATDRCADPSMWGVPWYMTLGVCCSRQPQRAGAPAQLHCTHPSFRH